MAAHVTERLQRAVSEGGAAATEAIFHRARRLRRRRRAVTGTLGGLVLALVAISGIGALGGPDVADVLLDRSDASTDWPLEVRYEIERFDESGEAHTTEVHEFGGTGWGDWAAVAVRTDVDRTESRVERFADGRHYQGEVALGGRIEEPFAALQAARRADLDPQDDLAEDASGRLAPNDLMNTRFATRREPNERNVVVEELPQLRSRVAADLDLDPDELIAQRITQGCDTPNPKACYELRYVALPAAQVPLYAEEINAEQGREARLRVTHLAFEAGGGG